MKRLKEFCLVILVLIFVLICMCSPASAEDCIATVSSDLKLHIPAVVFDTSIYFVDLQYTPSDDGIIWFDVAGAGAVDQLQCENTALLFPFSGTYSLYVPSVAVGTDQYWVNLEYVPDTAATAVAQTNRVAGSKGPRLKVNGVDRKGTNAPGCNRVPVKVQFASILKFTVNVGEAALQWGITVKGEAPLVYLPPLVEQPCPTSMSFLNSSGSLKVLQSSCDYIMTPPGVNCECGVYINGGGFFSVDDLRILNVDSPSPAITMKYSMGFPKSTIELLVRCCVKDGCSPVGSNDWSNAVFDTYSLLHQSEAVGGSIVATGWNFVEGGSGWLYATKVYPTTSKPCFENSTCEEVGASMSLVE